MKIQEFYKTIQDAITCSETSLREERSWGGNKKDFKNNVIKKFESSITTLGSAQTSHWDRITRRSVREDLRSIKIDLCTSIIYRRKRNKQSYAALTRIEDIKINGDKIYLKRVLEFYNTAKDEYLGGTSNEPGRARWHDANMEHVRTFIEENDPEQTITSISEIMLFPGLLKLGVDWNWCEFAYELGPNTHSSSRPINEAGRTLSGLNLGEPGSTYHAGTHIKGKTLISKSDFKGKPQPGDLLIYERVLTGSACSVWESPTFFDDFDRSFTPDIDYKLNAIATLNSPSLDIPDEIYAGKMSGILDYLRDSLPDGSIVIGGHEGVDIAQRLVFRKVDAKLENNMGTVPIDLTDFSEPVPRVHINKKCSLNYNGDNTEIEPGVYEILIPLQGVPLTDTRKIILDSIKMTSMTIEVNRMDFLSSIEAEESNLGASLRGVKLESLDVEDFDSNTRKGNLDRFQF